MLLICEFGGRLTMFGSKEFILNALKGKDSLAQDSILDASDEYENLCEDHQFILDYFKAKTSGNRLASRRDLIPRELISILPYISLLNIVTDKDGELLDMEFRLVGTSLVNLYGEWTGRKVQSDNSETSLKKTYPDTYKRLIDMASGVLQHRRAVMTSSQQMSEDRSYLKITNISIPLSSNGTDIDIIFVHSDIQKVP